MAGRGGLRKLKDTPACPCSIKKGAPTGGAFFPAECRSADGILACPGGGKYATAAGGQNCDCRRGREKGTVLRRRNGVEGSPFGRRATTIPTSAERERVCGGGTERRAAPQGRYLRSEAWQMGGKRLFDMLRRRRYRPARGSVRGVTTKARRAVFASLPSYGRDPSLRSG